MIYKCPDIPGGRKRARNSKVASFQRILRETHPFSAQLFKSVERTNRKGREELAFVRRKLDAVKFYRLFGDPDKFGWPSNWPLEWHGESAHGALGEDITQAKHWEEGVGKNASIGVPVAEIVEHVDMQSLEDWERTGEDRRPDQLRSYIKELRLRGETFQGVTRITRTYRRHCDDVNDKNTVFGRSYGPYLSLQNITREARFFATRHLGSPVKEADIHNAQPTCLWLSLVEHLGEEACSRRWPLLQRFVRAPDA